MEQLFTLSSDVVPSSNRVLAVHGTEAFSRPYSFEMFLHMPREAYFEMGEAVGKRATLTFNEPDGTPRESIHGLFSAVELVESLPDDELFRAILVPKLWWLSQNRHSRVFVNENLPAIIDKVLRAANWSDDDFRLVLRARGLKPESYPALEHVCQYGESDLDFLSRWMEREGIYYYFEEGEEQEKLVITDVAQTHKALAGGSKRYLPHQGKDGSPAEAFHSFRCTHVAQPAGVQVADHNYLQPDLAPLHEEKTAAGDGPLVSLFGENTTTPAEAKWLAQVRAQELRAHQVVYRGKGRVYGLRPGYRFSMYDHPRIVEDLLVTEVIHRGAQLDGAGDLRACFEEDEESDYAVEVVAIPVDVQYRPPRRTPVPRITGLESAVVDGEVEDRYAQLDDHGRYNVKIRFDESDLEDGRASTRVRMLQPHGGSEEGFHFPLRKGTEVMLAFQGGDPDRPVIVGVGPNPRAPSPVTRQNATQNVVQTGGQNKIVMEDTKDAEYFRASSPKEKSFLHLGAHDENTDKAFDHNMVLSTEGDGLVHTGAKLDVTVGTKDSDTLKVTVSGDVTESFQGNQTTHVVKKLDETVDDHVTQTFNKGLTQKITAAGETREVTGGMTETIKGGRKQTIEGGSTEEITGALKQTITEGAAIKTPARYEVTAAAGIKLATGAKCEIIAPAGIKTTAPAEHVKSTSYSAEFCGAKLSVIGAKTEIIPALALLYTANKIDFVGMKIDRVATVAFRQAQVAEIRSVSQAIAQGIVNIHQLGMFIVV